MKVKLQRQELLQPLQLTIGVVEKRQTLPILSNVLLRVDDNRITVIGTDLEVELVGFADLSNRATVPGAITVTGRKLFDICKSLPDEAEIELELLSDRLHVRSGRSRFSLSTLPVQDFPQIKHDDNVVKFAVTQNDLRFLTQRTYFAMAQQDVRYYLNGMLMEVKGGTVRTVATDGHRLALNTLNATVDSSTDITALIPYKGVTELMRLLQDDDTEITMEISNNHIRVIGANFIFTSKLIDGTFPSYERVLPQNGDKEVTIERQRMKQTLQRVSILTNEKFRGVRLHLNDNMMSIQANNPEQEEANEELQITYPHDSLELGFNVDYLVDVLNTISDADVAMTFSNDQTGVVIKESTSIGDSQFVVMPMRF